MDQDFIQYLWNLLVIIVAVSLAILLYILAHKYLFRYISRALRRPFIILFEIIILFFSLSIILASIAMLYGFHELFVIIFTLFIIASIILILGSRHIIEEYISGLFVSDLFDLKIGDYIEINGFRGHIVAISDTSIVIRDPHRDLIHIPYTTLLHKSFKKFRIEEGHEIIIPITIPLKTSIRTLREDILKIADELGMENTRISIESISENNIKIIIRGIIRDPRREEEIRYSLLDQIYNKLFQQ
ncbi:MAG: mechanosensitive ion channel domain-containing protein [Sulfolobales archaeon]